MHILKEVILCKTQESKVNQEKNPLCTTAFRLTSLELTLYKKLGLSVPEYCFPCRRHERFLLRNPRKLWHRNCMCDKPNHSHGVGSPRLETGGASCTEEFETSYAPERPEIIYCEKCYQAEVY